MRGAYDFSANAQTESWRVSTPDSLFPPWPAPSRTAPPMAKSTRILDGELRFSASLPPPTARPEIPARAAHCANALARTGQTGTPSVAGTVSPVCVGATGAPASGLHGALCPPRRRRPGLPSSLATISPTRSGHAGTVAEAARDSGHGAACTATPARRAHDPHSSCMTPMGQSRARSGFGNPCPATRPTPPSPRPRTQAARADSLARMGSPSAPSRHTGPARHFQDFPTAKASGPESPHPPRAS